MSSLSQDDNEYCSNCKCRNCIVERKKRIKEEKNKEECKKERKEKDKNGCKKDKVLVASDKKERIVNKDDEWWTEVQQEQLEKKVKQESIMFVLKSPEEEKAEIDIALTESIKQAELEFYAREEELRRLASIYKERQKQLDELYSYSDNE